MRKKDKLIVINPASGRSTFKDRLRYLRSRLEESGNEPAEFFTTHEGKGFLNAYLKDHPGIKELIVLGGDGTLNYVVNEMLDKPVPLSIVSNGTGNDSVKSLHGVLDFKKQVEIAINGKARGFDLGLCNGRAFVNGLGIGFDGQVVQEMSKRRKKRGRHLDYLLTVLRTVARFKEKDIRFALDGELYERKVLLMTVSNGTTFGGGFVINPRARADDGWLDVCVLNEISPLARFWHLPKLKTGSHDALGACEFHKAEKVQIEAANDLVAHLDGEFLGHPPFDVSIVPNALQVRVPE